MRHYSLFIIAALLLHALLLIPFWLKPDWGQALVGGGSGAVISISVEPTILQEKGHTAVHPKKPRPATKGYDSRQADHAGNGAGTSAGPGVGAGSSREGRSEVLAQIRSRIERAKRYPLMARRRGLEGTADVTFRIQQDGSVGGLKLAQASGASSLDEAALSTIRRAAPFPYYPEPIRIGIRFALRKKTD
jgi:TonB family protein